MWLTAKRKWRLWRSGPAIMVVSGLPRSGTSMTMKMLEAGGVALSVDHVREADVDNPKGYFELERVKKLQEEPDKSWLAGSRGKAVKVVSELLKALPGDHFYRVVFMRRHLQEVMASQNKMLERRGEPLAGDDEMIRELFERHLRITQFWLARQPNFETLYLDYAKVVADPEPAATAMRDFLGLELDVERMCDAVDGRLYRNRRRPKRPV